MCFGREENGTHRPSERERQRRAGTFVRLSLSLSLSPSKCLFLSLVLAAEDSAAERDNHMTKTKKRPRSCSFLEFFFAVFRQHLRVADPSPDRCAVVGWQTELALTLNPTSIQVSDQ